MIDTTELKSFQGIVGDFLPKFFAEGFETAKLVQFVNENVAYRRYFDYLVVTLIRKAFDSGHEWVVETVGGLLVVLVSAKEVSTEQVSRAFEKLYHIIDDLALDVPEVYKSMVFMTKYAIKDKILPVGFETRMPLSVLLKFRDDGMTEYSELIEALTKFKQSAKAFLETSKPDIEQDIWTVSLNDAFDEVSIFIKNHDFRRNSFMHEFLRMLLVASMNRTNREREVVSQLLVQGGERKWFTRDDIMFGFMRTFMNLPDTSLDVPNASIYMAKFMARAVVDEVLPRSFLDYALSLHLGGDMGMTIANKVYDWLDPSRRKNLASKYEDIWVGSDPSGEVAMQCRRKTRDIVYNLFADRSIDDCVKALEREYLTPDLATICVRVIIESILEKNSDDTCVKLAKLLIARLIEGHEIDGENVKLAFEFLSTTDRQQELIKDVGPTAPEQLMKIYNSFEAEGLLVD